MAKIDRKTVTQLKKITSSLFTSEMKWKAIGLFVLLATFSISLNYISARLSYIGRDFITALSLRDSNEFYKQLYLYLLGFAIATPVVVFYRYTEERTALFWRKWFSRRILKRYFDNLAYYKINLFSSVDNPDQRIEEDIRDFTNMSLSFTLILFNSLIQLFIFMGILWSISSTLTYAVFAYAILGSIITYFLGRPLIDLNFIQKKKEADYRYKLVNLRDNAESIAFLGDEEKEYTRTRQRLKYALTNQLAIFNCYRRLNFFTTGYNYIIGILPTVIVAPLFLAEKIEFGVVTQAGFGFTVVLGALSIIVQHFYGLSNYAATINRLGSFWDALSQAEKEIVYNGERINYLQGESVKFENINILTPRGDGKILSNLTFEIEKGGLLITGPSGSGKSSILRSLAGLWTAGSGLITRPDLSKAVFFPQRPYMILGSLRNQLLYSTHRSGVSDKKLKEVLIRVGLVDVLKRIPNFDTVMDWPSILSTGEQQRLAFARLLLAKPKLAILDEATTALDSASEEMMYRIVQETAGLYISVGYRETLEKFHSTIITLTSEGSWKFETI